MARHRRGSSQQVLEAHGKEIVQSGTILDLGSFRYKVSSQSVADAFYDVSFGPDGWRCTCQYHLHGKRRCKHIRAVCSIVMDTGRLADEGRKGMTVTEPCVTCTFCQGTDCIKRGVRNNKNGTVPRYKCSCCGRKFTHNPGFGGRHHPPEVITDVLQSYAAGLSTNRITDCLAKKGIGVSASTVWRWARDYGKLLGRYQKTCMTAGYVWHADEIYFRVRGQPRWMFGVMDAETKLIIAHDTAQDKIGYDAAELFEDAVKAAGKRPDVLITDGLAGFKTGYRKAMYTLAMPRTVHVADVGIRDRHPANNAYERFNGEIRDRIALGTRVQVQGSGTAWPADHIPQLHASARGPGWQDSGGGCRDHGIGSGQMAHPDRTRGIVLRIMRASNHMSGTGRHVHVSAEELPETLWITCQNRHCTCRAIWIISSLSSVTDPKSKGQTSKSPEFGEEPTMACDASGSGMHRRTALNDLVSGRTAGPEPSRRISILRSMQAFCRPSQDRDY